MMGADLVRLLVLASVVLTGFTHRPLLLAAMNLVMGLGEGVFRPAYGSLLPAVVPLNLRIQANALTSTATRFAGIFGPGLAGVLATVVGARGLYAIDAATFIASVTTLGLMSAQPDRVRARRGRFLADLRNGFREAKRHRWVPPMLALFAVKMCCAVAPAVVLLPIICLHRFGDYAVYGWSNAALAAGALVGTLAAARLRPVRRGTMSLTWMLLYTAIPVALLWAPWWPLLIVAYLAGGVALAPVGLFWEVALQGAIPPDRMARVSSLDWLASFATLPLGMALVGPAVAAIGQTSVLVLGIVVSVVPNFVLLLIPDVRTFGPVPADGWIPT